MGIDVGFGATSRTSRAQTVQDRITSQLSDIAGLAAQVEAILNELAALEPPRQGASEDEISFTRRLGEFQRKLSAVQRRLQDAQNRLAAAQAELDRLMSQDLPRAQRDDAEELRRQIEAVRKQIEAATRALKERIREMLRAGGEATPAMRALLDTPAAPGGLPLYEPAPLLAGGRPPNVPLEVWERLPMDEQLALRNAYLAYFSAVQYVSYVAQRGDVEPPHLGNDGRPDGIAAETWRHLSGEQRARILTEVLRLTGLLAAKETVTETGIELVAYLFNHPEIKTVQDLVNNAYRPPDGGWSRFEETCNALGLNPAELSEMRSAALLGWAVQGPPPLAPGEFPPYEPAPLLAGGRPPNIERGEWLSMTTIQRTEARDRYLAELAENQVIIDAADAIIAEGGTHLTENDYQILFRAVEIRTGVPADVLKAVAFTEGLGIYHADRVPRQFVDGTLAADGYPALAGEVPGRDQRVLGVDLRALLGLDLPVMLGDDRAWGNTVGIGMMQVTVDIDRVNAALEEWRKAQDAGRTPDPAILVQQVVGGGPPGSRFPGQPVSVDVVRAMTDPYYNILAAAYLFKHKIAIYSDPRSPVHRDWMPANPERPEEWARVASTYQTYGDSYTRILGYLTDPASDAAPFVHGQPEIPGTDSEDEAQGTAPSVGRA